VALTAGYRECPAEFRERLVERAGDAALVRSTLGARYGGAVLLSTCNRFEVYASTVPRAGDERPESLLQALGLPPQPGLRELRGAEAAEHLFRVAGGLESMVLGESEILGQVRRAYTGAVEAGVADATLSHLFHEALRVGRRAREETGIGRSPLSLPAVAARVVRERLGTLDGVRPLIVGTGEAALLAARAMRNLGAGTPVFVGGDPCRARIVAGREGGRGIALAQIETALPGADVVIAARGGGEPAIRADMVNRSQGARRGRAVVILDLAAPRDVDPAAASVPGITLVGLDDLERTAARHRQSRCGEVPAVELLVSEACRDFEQWQRSRATVPSITALTEWAESLRQRQLAKALRGRQRESGEMNDVLEGFSHGLVRQLLHPLIAAMRDEEEGPENARALTALLGIGSEAGS